MNIRFLALGLACTALAGGCAQEQREVSFSKSIQPLLDTRCVSCHKAPDGEGYTKSGLLLDSYQGLMKGTRFGPVVVPGDSLNSTLMTLVEGRADPSINMPHSREPLSEEEVDMLRDWINQGAKNN
jgi:hypothetical protein